MINLKSLAHSPTPSHRLTTLLATGLSLSIGWGIRGNFGHQHGAAFAGCLAALTVCILSGREDWRSKILYFAFFGSIGWGFGATVSYMQVIAYTESGHFSSQWYGYVCLFIIGFLWAALGVAGTALAAVADKKDLAAFFKPILFVFGAWLLLDLVEDPIATLLQPSAQFDGTWSRHRNPLYWFDANYLPAAFALLAAGLFDLQDRKERDGWWLPLYGIAGALAGWGLQSLIRLAGWEQGLGSLLTYPLGDTSYINPDTKLPAYDLHNLLNNWPQWFNDYPHHIGWFIGAVAGITLYFRRFGKFRSGSSLIVYMAGGWLVFFIVFPVLGSIPLAHHGGIRMTPPRSDDWAGIVGVCTGTLVWLRRHNYWPVATAAVLGGTIGGLGFSGIQWIKQFMMAPGSPRILANKGIVPGSAAYEQITATWANWQHQNWHSFLEQSYGFVNGIAVAVALGFLATRIPAGDRSAARTSDPDTPPPLPHSTIPGSSLPSSLLPAQDASSPTPAHAAVHAPVSSSATRPLPAPRTLSIRWTLALATIFVLLVIPYTNLVKNVDSWGNQLKPEVWKQVVPGADASAEKAPALWDVPYIGRLPGVHFLHLTPEGWFDLTWILVLAIFCVLIRRHFRKPLSMIPTTWLGKGQLIFLLLLWLMVIGNFERALTGWSPERLLTEWVVLANAVLTTLLVLVLPSEEERGQLVHAPLSFRPLYKKAWKLTGAAVLISSLLFLFTNRIVYQYPPYEQLDTKHIQTRFGPEATWRAKPILKNAEHR